VNEHRGRSWNGGVGILERGQWKEYKPMRSKPYCGKCGTDLEDIPGKGHGCPNGCLGFVGSQSIQPQEPDEDFCERCQDSGEAELGIQPDGRMLVGPCPSCHKQDKGES